MSADTPLTLAKRIKSIADIGLLYSKDAYDRERYTELLEVALELTAQLIDKPVEVVKDFYAPVTDYPTPKVDIRGFAVNDRQEILLVREGTDKRWTLPGGWADIGLTPAEVAVKEFKEETGLVVSPQRLLAVFDKKVHPHPPQPFYVYKMVILCKIEGELNFEAGHDMLESAFYPVDQLPELSEDRILKSQIELLHSRYLANELMPVLD